MLFNLFLICIFSISISLFNSNKLKSFNENIIEIPQRLDLKKYDLFQEISVSPKWNRRILLIYLVTK